MKKFHILLTGACMLPTLVFLTACGDKVPQGQPDTVNPPANTVNVSDTTDPDVDISDVDLEDPPVASSPSTTAVGSRDNTSYCLETSAPEFVLYNNDVAYIDASNASEGYISVKYTGTCAKVKLQITGSNQVTYTYNLIGNNYEAFPLTCETGSYTVGIYENISGTQYATCLKETLDVTITNEFGPYLYPNQYVDFTPSCDTVAKGAELASTANSDLDVVSNVYNYIISSISYDYDKAANIASGYTSNVDEILHSGMGICLDYAAVMSSMLRSQGIPTRLEVGYAGDAYHAWISTYIEDRGWVNGIIEFDGTDWELMDPTFGANSSEKKLRDFIGSGDNYTVKYIY